MKLYDLAFSPNSHKVRAVALELGIPLELQPVNLMAGEGHTPAFLAKNPNGKIPTLEDGDLVLWESNAIVCYLAAKKPEANLLPTEPRARAEVDRWLFWQAATLAPAIAPVCFERAIKPMMGGTADEAVVARGLEEVARYLPVLEQALAGREYLAGRLTVADFSVACSITMAAPAQVDLSAYPNITSWFERITSRDSWKKSAPQHG